MQQKSNIIHYTAAGGVVMNPAGDQVLLLVRPSRDEIRLPKGHVETTEALQEAALREVQEEAGYGDLAIVADLGELLVTFLFQGNTIQRVEHYYLMRAQSMESCERPPRDAAQFFPVWVNWEDAEAELTFEAEQEWIKRARAARETLHV